MSKKLNILDIRKRCHKIHSNKYRIPNQNYIDIFARITVICKTHGEFDISTKNLLSGHGCSKCAGVEKSSIVELRKKCNKIHGDKFIIPNQEYINAKTDIKVICKKHIDNDWFISPTRLLKRKGCPICTKKHKLDLIDVRIKCENAHKGKGYTIKNQNYVDNNTNILVTCPKHGDWPAKPQNLFNGCGCPKCNSSKAEIKIEKILKENNIKFIPQKKFENCKHIKKLPFDFYLSEYNICIEYDGEQHFKRFHFEKDDIRLEKRQKLDEIKNEYCRKNNIHLIRISYFQNINEELSKFLFIYSQN
jgi:hypothetical protein